MARDGCPAESWSQTLPVQPSQHERNFATFLFTVVAQDLDYHSGIELSEPCED